MYKLGQCYVQNSFAYAPERTMDSRDKTEEATSNLGVCGKFSVTAHAHERTSHMTFFLCLIKTDAPVFQQMHLSHKIRANFLIYTIK